MARDSENKVGVLQHSKEEAEFHRHVALWKDETAVQSSIHLIAMHPSYQRIIGMGQPVLPLLFEELRRDPDQWFWALQASTGEDPGAPYEDFERAVERWLDWGHERGYV